MNVKNLEGSSTNCYDGFHNVVTVTSKVGHNFRYDTFSKWYDPIYYNFDKMLKILILFSLERKSMHRK